jgi:hypothetical protein
MWDFQQPYFEDKMISSEQAWRTLDEWRAGGRELGVWYVAKSGSIRTLGTVKSARNERLTLSGPAARADFDLKGARFTHGPFQMFPRWPAGPMVEVMAVQAFLPHGEWLVLVLGQGRETRFLD